MPDVVGWVVWDDFVFPGDGGWVDGGAGVVGCEALEGEADLEEGGFLGFGMRLFVAWGVEFYAQAVVACQYEGGFGAVW